MKSRIKISIGVISCLFVMSLHAQDETDKTTTYKNQRGSTMMLTWHQQQEGSGMLSGSFTSAVGNCKSAIGKTVPLTGYYNGNAVAVAINYPGCNSVLAMSGVTTGSDRNAMTMHWMVSQHVEDPTHENWDSFIMGTDQYKKL